VPALRSSSMTVTYNSRLGSLNFARVSFRRCPRCCSSSVTVTYRSRLGSLFGHGRLFVDARVAVRRQRPSPTGVGSGHLLVTRLGLDENPSRVNAVENSFTHALLALLRTHTTGRDGSRLFVGRFGSTDRLWFGWLVRRAWLR